jgi:hypothetical protein
MDSMDDYYHGGEDGGGVAPTTTATATSTATSIENDPQVKYEHDTNNNGDHPQQMHHTSNNDYDNINNSGNIVNGTGINDMDEQELQHQQLQLPIPDDNCKIFVGALSWQTTEDALRMHFEKYGSVYSVEVVRDRHTGGTFVRVFVVSVFYFLMKRVRVSYNEIV